MTDKTKTSCGFIINTAAGWLICHSTGNKHWDFPKGIAEEEEDHLAAAVRETIEETGLDLTAYKDRAVDLGCAPYSKQKSVHLFLLDYPEPVDLLRLTCISMVDRGTYQYPEVDQYELVTPAEALTRLSKSMRAWLEVNVPNLLQGATS